MIMKTYSSVPIKLTNGETRTQWLTINCQYPFSYILTSVYTSKKGVRRETKEDNYSTWEVYGNINKDFSKIADELLIMGYTLIN